MKRNQIKRIFAAAVLGALAVSSGAYAQFIWLDEKGVKQYSDMPPPASVSKKRILKEPGSSSSVTAARAEPAAEGSPPATAVKDKNKDKAPMTTAEKNADFLKRRAEQAEKEKKAAEDAQMAADKAKNCEHARAYQRALQSGERVARADKNGERYFLSDEQRAKEAQDARRVVESCK
jgi:hypothetical protein